MKAEGSNRWMLSALAVRRNESLEVTSIVPFYSDDSTWQARKLLAYQGYLCLYLFCLCRARFKSDSDLFVKLQKYPQHFGKYSDFLYETEIKCVIPVSRPYVEELESGHLYSLLAKGLKHMKVRTSEFWSTFRDLKKKNYKNLTDIGFSWRSQPENINHH